MIVVIDTNVWISALQFAKRRGTPTLALEKAMSEDVIATCDEIDAEIVSVLTEKFSWEQHRATSALQTILARSGGSYFSQSDLRLHFGLGTAAMVDTVEVRWPNGLGQTFHHLAANRIYRLYEGRATPE